MQEIVVVQPLSAMAAMKSPKPFSSAAVHSVLVMRHSSGCAPAPDDPINKKLAADRTNATLDEARTWGTPALKTTLALNQISERKTTTPPECTENSFNLFNRKRKRGTGSALSLT